MCKHGRLGPFWQDTIELWGLRYKFSTSKKPSSFIIAFRSSHSYEPPSLEVLDYLRKRFHYWGMLLYWYSTPTTVTGSCSMYKNKSLFEKTFNGTYQPGWCFILNINLMLLFDMEFQNLYWQSKSSAVPIDNTHAYWNLTPKSLAMRHHCKPAKDRKALSQSTPYRWINARNM